MTEQDSLANLYAQARERGALIDLSDRAKWRLTGADRVRYLNGQVTNDIRRARSGVAMTACVTTAKGRLCGLIFVSASPDYLRIDSEADLREALTARLEQYIIADDAALEDVTETECLFHLLGASADEVTAVAESVDGGEVRTATRFGAAGADVIAPRSGYEMLLRGLKAGHVLVPEAIAECLRIEAGVPRWGAELTEETLPPEAALDKTAIDYHKGCYIGQEVISRIKSVGHVNRRLVGLVGAGPLHRGDTLRISGGADGKHCGEITSAAWSFGLESWAALGYLKRGSAEAALEACSADGSSVSVQARELPLFL